LNSFPTQETDKDVIKRDNLHNLIKVTQADIVLTQEDNRHWPAVHSAKRPTELAKQWMGADQATVWSASNTNETITTQQFQPGGVSICSMKDALSRTIGKGTDPTMLGRWAWVTLQGRSNTKTRIYTIYVPVKSTGKQSVYKQHARHHTRNGNMKSP